MTQVEALARINIIQDENLKIKYVLLYLLDIPLSIEEHECITKALERRQIVLLKQFKQIQDEIQHDNTPNMD